MARIHILGAGALGSLFAVSLFRAGSNPCLIARDAERANNLRHAGIRCDGAAYPIDTVGPDKLANSSIECLLLCTKAQDSLTALAAIEPALRPETAIICLQNGIGQHAAIAAQYPAASIFAALCTEGVTRTGSGEIIHAGVGHTDIGQLYGPPLSLPKALSEHRLKVNISADILPALWRKLAINGAINGLTVIHDCRNGELLQRSDVYNELCALVEEIATVLRAAGHGDASLDLFEQVRKVCTATAMNTSSMLQDFRAQRRSERDYVYGTLLREADLAGLEAPMLKQLNQQLIRRETV